MTDVFQPMLTGTRLIATRDEATFKTAPTTGTLYLHNGMTGYSQDTGNRHKNFGGQGQMYYTVSALLDLMGQATHAMPTVFYELLIADMNRLFGVDPAYYSKDSSTVPGTDIYTWRLPRYGIRRQVPSFTLYEGEPAYCLRRTGGFLTAWNIASERSGDVTGGQSSTYATILNDTAFPGTGTDDTFTVTLTGSPDGGSFTLTGYDPDTGAVWVSSAIAWNATAAQIATAITNSPNVPAGAVVAGTVPGGPLPAAATVKAAGPWAGQPIPTPTLGTNSLTVSAVPGGGVTIGAGVAGLLPTSPALTPTGVTPLVPGLVQHSYGAYAALDSPDSSTAWLLNAAGGTVIEASSFDFTSVAGPGFSEETSQSFAYFKDMLDQNNGRADNIRLNLTFDDSDNDVLVALKNANLSYIDPSSAALCAAAAPSWHQWRCGPCGLYDFKLRIYGAATDPFGRDDRGGNYVRSVAIGPHVNPSLSDAAGSPVECILKVPTPA